MPNDDIARPRLASGFVYGVSEILADGLRYMAERRFQRLHDCNRDAWSAVNQVVRETCARLFGAQRRRCLYLALGDMSCVLVERR